MMGPWLVTAPTGLLSRQRSTTALHTLGALSGWGPGSIGYGVNDSGMVVGNSGQTSTYGQASGATHAFLYDGTMHDLGTLGGSYSGAAGINSSGQVVGWASNGTNTRAFLYDGTMHDLGTLGGALSYARTISDSGEVVGASSTADGMMHGFVYDGIMHDLGTLVGYAHSWAYDINSSGVIVGFVGQLAGEARQAFVYDGMMHGLGTLSDYMFSGALGINDDGLIVGYASTITGATCAFLYDGQSMLDLNALISPGSGWRLATADAINNNGQILCHGYDSVGGLHPLLLTPTVPEPSGLIALVCGLGSVAMFARRRGR